MNNEWKQLLEELSSRLLEDETIKELLADEQLQWNWLGYPPATIEQVYRQE